MNRISHEQLDYIEDSSRAVLYEGNYAVVLGKGLRGQGVPDRIQATSLEDALALLKLWRVRLAVISVLYDTDKRLPNARVLLRDLVAAAKADTFSDRLLSSYWEKSIDAVMVAFEELDWRACARRVLEHRAYLVFDDADQELILGEPVISTPTGTITPVYEKHPSKVKLLDSCLLGSTSLVPMTAEEFGKYDMVPDHIHAVSADSYRLAVVSKQLGQDTVIVLDHTESDHPIELKPGDWLIKITQLEPCELMLSWVYTQEAQHFINNGQDRRSFR